MTNGTPFNAPASGEEPDGDLAARRWRMVLGRYAEPNLPRRHQDADLDDALGYVYDREYTGRGHRLGAGGGDGTGATLGPSVIRAVDWLDGARRLFPASTWPTRIPSRPSTPVPSSGPRCCGSRGRSHPSSLTGCVPLSPGSSATSWSACSTP